MVRAFEVTAIIIGIFFTVGMVVGFLIVMAIPVFGRIRGDKGRQVQPYLHSDPWDQLNLGPPGQSTPTPDQEPDDRDDYPWWPSQR